MLCFSISIFHESQKKYFNRKKKKEIALIQERFAKDRRVLVNCKN